MFEAFKKEYKRVSEQSDYQHLKAKQGSRPKATNKGGVIESSVRNLYATSDLDEVYANCAPKITNAIFDMKDSLATEAEYNELKGKYDELQKSYDNLQKHYDSLANILQSLSSEKMH